MGVSAWRDELEMGSSSKMLKLQCMCTELVITLFNFTTYIHNTHRTQFKRKLRCGHWKCSTQYTAYMVHSALVAHIICT